MVFGNLLTFMLSTGKGYLQCSFPATYNRASFIPRASITLATSTGNIYGLSAQSGNLLVNKTDLQALYLCGTHCYKTGTRPPSCICLDNQLKMAGGRKLGGLQSKRVMKIVYKVILLLKVEVVRIKLLSIWVHSSLGSSL